MSVPAHIAERLAALSPQKRELLERELRERGLLPRVAAIVARTEPQASYPLSLTQQRLWFLHQLEPRSSAYNMFSQLHVAGGEIATGVLGRAFAGVIGRHEALRTRFVETEGEPAQVIDERLTAALAEVDLSALQPRARAREAGRLADRYARLPFDLERGPLVRVLLVRLRREEQRVCVAMHHIVSDGWSMTIFYRELMALYTAYAGGRPSPLAALPVQYADFALWQRRALDGAALAEHAAWWREQLAGAPPLLALPWDRLHPAVASHHGGAVRLTLSAQLTAALRQLARTEKTTLFIVLLAVFQSLLARWSGEDDVVVGSPIAGRHYPEIEPLIGFFVNTLVLRTLVDPGTGLRELLAKVQAMHQEATLHQDLPFERLVEELQPERSLQHNPIFQVGFAFQRDPSLDALRTGGAAGEPGGGKLQVVELGADTAAAQDDLGCSLLERDDVVTGALSFNTALFDPTTIRRLAHGFERLLTAAVAEPRRTIGELPMLSAGEAHQLCCEHNDTAPAEGALPSQGGLGIAASFAVTAARVSERVAIVSGDRQLSYGELARRAARLASRLRRLGAGAETRIGIALERAPELLVGLLGVLESGAAWVPLDLAYPRERLAAMIEDAGCRLLVSEVRLAAALPEHAAQLVTLDDLDLEPPLLEVFDPAPASAAYVLFTSGSTGKPKGVVVSRAAFANVLAAIAARPGMAESDAMLAVTSFAFDVAGPELLLPLLVGARIELAGGLETSDGAALGARLAAARVSVMQATPATWRLVLGAGWPGSAGLRAITTGEALPPELAVVLAAHTGSLWNLYGPTETTVWSTLDRVEPATARRVTIGRPIAGTRTYVVDRGLAVQPLGAAGQLLIGGAGVARGYLGRPAATAERFIPDPFAAMPGERVYCTGDRVRVLGDGRIDYQGRLDHQVKLRGFRIELGEIETLLARRGEVAQAVVVVDHSQADDPRLVACVVPAAGAACDPAELRRALAEVLPAYMVPALFLSFESLPETPSGKLDRAALGRALAARLSETQTAPGAGSAREQAPRSELEAKIAAIWCEVLRVERVGVHASFFDLGGHSLLLPKVRSRLLADLGCAVEIVDLFRFPTVVTLAEHLRPRLADARIAGARIAGARLASPRLTNAAASSESVRRALAVDADTRIAVVGMAFRFPGAETPEQLWANLAGGVESVEHFTDERLLAAGVDPALIANPAYVKATAPIEDIDLFDTTLFAMSPREAEITDPQHRIFLKCAWEALERAGCDPESFDGRVGVFAGVAINRYLANVLSNPKIVQTAGSFQVLLGNDKDFLTTRVSYKLDLNGPSVDVQTACSTSLVATHLACHSLLLGESDLALAGGVSVSPDQIAGYVYEPGGIASPDGRCRAFDAEGLGTVGGNGAGVVALKRLADAERDGDPIYGVLLATAINNDGSGKIGFTAPSFGGQAAVIAEAQAMAGVRPEEIGLVEAHGTATPLGDPIEVAALGEVFGKSPGHRCALGSIKTNIGHLDTAAGVAGLIKATLAVGHGQIPPSLHFEHPNPEIDFDRGPFFVPTALEDWPVEGRRRAAVSSFGLGGTNAHAVLEQAPDPTPSGPSRQRQLLVLSAASAQALEGASDRLADYLETHSEVPLADVAHTLRVGRRRLEHRRCLVARDAAEAARALRERSPESVLSALEERRDRPVVFLLPGVGDHYQGMAAGLYPSEPVFRATLDRAAEVLLPILGRDLRELLFAAAEPAQGEGLDLRRLLGRGAPQPAAELERTLYAQPAVFAVSVALARLWEEWGVVPEAMLGYSLGEYAAACLAGVFSFEDGLRLVAERAKLIEELPAGAMTAVPLPAAELAPWLADGLALAATNTPQVSVVSGSPEAIAGLETRLAASELASVRLRTSHAFHSPQMATIAERFTALLAGVALQAPERPYLSNVTGGWVRAEEATDPGYWVRHLCGTVRFAEGMAELLADPERILVEVGPGQALATAARQHPARAPRHAVVASLRDERDRRDDLEVLLGAAGRLWLAGAALDWHGLVRAERRRKVVLPTYAFDERRYWLAPGVAGAAAPARRRTDPADWFYVPSWRSAELAAGAAVALGGPCLVLADDAGLGAALAARLGERGETVVVVRPGGRFTTVQGAAHGTALYQLDPGRRDDYAALFAALAAEGRLPVAVVHLWALGGAPPATPREAEQRLDKSFFSLLFLAQAWVEAGGHPARLLVVTSGVHAVDGGETLVPEHAAALGPARVIPQELGLTGHGVDVLIPADARERAQLAAQLVDELGAPVRELAVAYRRGRRWVQVLEPQRLEPRPVSVVRPRGSYLVLGGLGGIGFALARDLVRAGAGRLALTVRNSLPERAGWPGWLETHAADDATSQRILAVRELESLGAEVMVVAADAADAGQLETAIAAVRARFGAIHGVIHSAGVAGQGMALLKSPEQVRAVLLPKVVAPRVLDRAFAGQTLDFMVLVSSIGSLLGGLGQIDYCAANAVLDTWAYARSGRTVALNYGVWKETGLALHVELPEAYRAEHAAMVSHGMTTEDGVAAFRRALERPLPQLAFAPLDLVAQLRRSLELDAARGVHGERPQIAHPRPELATGFVAPRGSTETELARIWGELLGIAQIGAHDDFFELGGDSLIGTQVSSRVRQVLGVELPVRALFETPTLAGLARQLDHGLELGRPAASTIVPAARGAQIPLSFSQERMWFVEQLLPGLAVNHLVAVMRLGGALDVPALAAALTEILRRHEVLRTGLVAEGGQPWQKIAPPAPLALPFVDLGRLEPAVRVPLARKLAAELARRPFDLARGPFLRASVLRLAERDHVVPFLMHHIASDGWSMGVLVNELAALYNAYHQRRPSPLPELAVQYADFALWQRGWLSGEVLAGELAYWREQLRGLPPTLELPTDRPRPLTPSFVGGRLTLEIGPALAGGLNALAARSGATLFMTLVAMLDAVLWRITGQEDFAIGTPIAGRNRAEIEGLIGFFVNTQVLRATLGPHTSFQELLAQTRERALGAYVHQDLPFEKLVEELQPERNIGRSPFFQVMFVLQNAPAGMLALADLELVPFAGASAEVRSELGLDLVEAGDGIFGQLSYRRDLFDPTTAERFRRHLLALLAAALAAPERPLGALDFLTAPERHHLLAEHNDWRAEGAVEQTVEAVLAEGQGERAERVALTAGDSWWSYDELFGRAHALARRLRALGAGPERVVGVCLERSPEWLIALLAVIESGAVYLPLDPHLPPERIAFMLADAQTGPRLVVSDAARRALLPAGLEIVELDDDRAQAPPPRLARPENPLYALYTSGSTGTPKGVVITHRSVATRLVWSRRWDAIDEPHYLAKATVSFDVSLLESLLPLALGGRIVLVPQGGQWDVPFLLETIARERLSHASFPPSMHTVLLEQPGLERLRSLAVIYTAAEEIKSDLVDRILERVQAPLVNRYGPTEITIAALGAECLHGDTGRAVPIGRPLGGASALVLDRVLKPVPIGVLGELAIGGPGLARGYLRRPATTAAVFVPDPFGETPGERLYRTGDLARQRADGRVEFHGRVDRQVKVRGFRIELGEVEAALRRHPEVVEAVVVDRKEASGLVQLVGWVVAANGSALDAARSRSFVAQLRSFVAGSLPDHMVPAAIGLLGELPRMPSGKVDRRELQGRPIENPLATPAAEPGAPVALPGELEEAIAEVWREVLGREQVGAEENFFDLGGHSLLLVRMQSRLRETLGVEVPMIELFRYPTIAALAGTLRGLGASGTLRGLGAAPVKTAQTPAVRRAPAADAAIAVVGLAGRFPGADDMEQLWQNLRQGVDSVTFWSKEELAAAGVSEAMLDNPAYVRAMGRLERADCFDAGLFGMSPREAQLTDPQQRLFLECAFAALEDAACDPDAFAGQIGVFGGVGLNLYWANLLANPEIMAGGGFLAATLGNDKDFLATRVSYKLGLRGPSVNVQSACSTALVAVHLACRSLQGGECDLALAGGVSVTVGEPAGYFFEPDGILSPDGHCRAYDARAEGTVGGQGVGIAVLKRLDDALRDGDPIRAVIRGTAINNDGSVKIGFTAPSVDGQARVIREALAAAGVEPAAIGMIEGHGSATPLGDPIEVSALLEVFRGLPAESCALGSVKTNFGHVGAAAGIAGLTKAVLALEHGEIPPSLYFEQPNPRIDFAAGPFFVPTRAQPWPRPAAPQPAEARRAGVSSFGLGGTNAHVVLEAAPVREPSGPSRPWQLLLLSAASESALEAVSDRLAAHLEHHPEQPLADVAATLRGGRRRLKHRRALVCRDTADAAAVLAGRDPRRLLGAVEERGARPVAFLFSGLGDHYPQMARELYDHEPTFRNELDRCAEGLSPWLGCDLREVLFPGPAPATSTQTGAQTEGAGAPDLRRLLGRAPVVADPARARLEATRIAQPAVFAIEWSLAALLGEWGLVPEAMLGYSLGEFTAAAVAGVLSLDDALRVVAERAALIDELAPGAMLAVPLSEEELRPLLGDELSFAAQNGPRVSVAAGPVAAIEALERTLAEREIASQRLRTSHAFHSRAMEQIAPRFAALLAGVELREPRIPYLSNVTGTWIRPEQARDPEYWVRHLCGTVRFADGLEQLLAGGRALIEVGPGQALATAARQHPARGAETVIVAALRDEREAASDLAFLLGSLGRLWLAGVRPDWRGFERHERRLKVKLPGYPFERQRYFLEAKPAAAVPARKTATVKSDLADWFYVPVWRFSAPPPPATAETLAAAGPFLLLDAAAGVGELLGERLRALGQTVTAVAAGAALEPLLAKLAAAGAGPRTIVHLGLLGNTAPAGAAGFESHQEAGTYRLLELVRALSKTGFNDPLRLVVVADRLHRVDTADLPEPAKTTVLGLLRVLPQELRNVDARSLELDTTGAEADVERLLVELAAPPEASERTIAWRGGVRRVEGFDPLRLPGAAGARPGLRERGVYLLTGGFGRVGEIVARDLAERVQARLVLVGRGACPPREQWDEHLETAGADDPTRRRIALVRALETAGAEVLPFAADVADAAQLAAAVAAAEQRFGALDGVFHLAGNTRPDQIMASIETTDAETCRRHFASKAYGLYALDAALAGRQLDFRILFSSLATVLGGLGFAAYAAANAFLDGFAQAAPGWLAIDWDGFRQSEDLAGRDPNTMAPSQANDALHRLLPVASVRRAVVAVSDLETRLDRWVRLDPALAERSADVPGAVAANAFGRPALATPLVAPRDETEIRIAEVWQSLLGIAEIGVHDNFFELGGDSLLAVQLISRLRRALHVELPLQVFFQLPTVAQLAARLGQGAYHQEELSEIEKMLAEIKDLSPDEEAALLVELEAEGGLA